MKINETGENRIAEVLKEEFDRINRRDDGHIKTITEMENTVLATAEKFKIEMMKELKESQAQICVPQKKTVPIVEKNGNLSDTGVERY